MYKGEAARRRKLIYILLVNDSLLVNGSPPTTENGALYQSIVGNTPELKGIMTHISAYSHEHTKIVVLFLEQIITMLDLFPCTENWYKKYPTSI